MSGNIVYYSTYGSTKQYAEILAQKLQWPLYSWKEAKSRTLIHSDIVVMASNIRIGKLKIRKWARKHRGILRDKALYVLAVGANAPDEQDYYIETAMKSLDFLDLKRENIFGLGGIKHLSELKRTDAFLFRVLDKIIREGTMEREILLDADHFNPQDLNPVVMHIKRTFIRNKNKETP